MVSFKKIEYIYHIHDITFRQDTDTDELLTFAKKQGYKHLFFTEHLPIGTNDSKDRPTIYRLKKFRDEIMSKAPKYNIEVEFGIEAEWPKTNNKYYREIKKNPMYQFAVFGNHFYKTDAFSKRKRTEWEILLAKMARDKEFRKQNGSNIDKHNLDVFYKHMMFALKSKIFSWVAHPDCWVWEYKVWDGRAIDLTKKIIAACKKYRIPVGFNAKRINKFKDDELREIDKKFWELVSKSNVKVILESDAHKISELGRDRMKYAYDTAIEFDLEDNLVEKIKLKYFNHKFIYKEVSAKELKQIETWEDMTFENGEHYSFKQLKSMHNNKKQYKIIGAYNDSHKICGYIIVTISDKIDIDKIYTDILYRHYGVGEGLIKYVSNKYNGKKLILEVSSTNTNAIQFYKKIRFVKVGLRKNYYGDGDHAIVLQK